MENKEKPCTKCEVSQPLTAFPANDRMRDGLDSICRKCRAIASREYYRRARERVGHSERYVKRHTMTDVDPQTQIGNCAICGPKTKAWKGGGKSRQRWRCANKVSQQSSRRVKEDPLKARVRRMRANGIEITESEYVGLVEAAGGCCQICGRNPDGLHLDHCHETGRVRGLLCSTCNTGLGKFGDSEERMEVALDYLRRFRRSLVN